MDYKVLNETVSSLGQVAESVFQAESALLTGDSLMDAAYAQKARVCFMDALACFSAGVPKEYTVRKRINLIIKKIK